ncbi:MAG TPA: DUF6471 domain-containing protein [Rubrivivax sp.]|nr:DUF6471 domain-containing protein [Rubrivivax sp.]
MANDSWPAAASQLLRIELRRRSVTYQELSTRLERIGVSLARKQLSNKVARGSFSLAFFMQCMHVLDVQAVRLFDAEVDRLQKRKESR